MRYQVRFAQNGSPHTGVLPQVTVGMSGRTASIFYYATRYEKSLIAQINYHGPNGKERIY